MQQKYEQVTEAVAFIVEHVQQPSGSRFSDLLKHAKAPLLERLVEALGSNSDSGHTKNVQHALWLLVLADSDELREVPSAVQAAPDPLRIANLVADYFMMLADGIYSKFKSTSFEIRLAAARSLDGLIEICSPTLSLFVPKTLAILKMALGALRAPPLQRTS